MRQELKIGQRIDVYEVKDNTIYTEFNPVGKSYIIDIDYEEHPGSLIALLVDVTGDSDLIPLVFYKRQLRKVGCFVVKEAYTNRDACTII